MVKGDRLVAPGTKGKENKRKKGTHSNEYKTNNATPRLTVKPKKKTQEDIISRKKQEKRVGTEGNRKETKEQKWVKADNY